MEANQDFEIVGYDETFQLYQELNFRLNDAERGSSPPLFQLESFIKSIVQGSDLTFACYSQNPNLYKTHYFQLHNSFLRLPFFFSLYSTRYSFSVPIQVFFNVCKRMGIMKMPFLSPLAHSSLPQYPAKYHSPLLLNSEVYDLLVSEIRQTLASVEYQKVLKLREETINNEVAKAKVYVDKCFDACSKMFVLRMELFNSQLKPELDVSQIQKNFKALTKLFNTHDAFLNIVGYLAKLEYSPIDGYFIHLAVLFDDRGSPPTVPWESSIVHYWEYLTNQQGYVINCEDEVNTAFPEKGVGKIRRDQQDKRDALERWVIGYICKSSLYLRATTKSGLSLFIPTKAPVNRDNSNRLIKDMLNVVTDKKDKVTLKQIENIYLEMSMLKKGNQPIYIGQYEDTKLNLLLNIERLCITALNDSRDAIDVKFDENNKPHFQVNPIGALLQAFGDLTALGAMLNKDKIDFDVTYSIFVDLFCDAISEYNRLRSLSSPLSLTTRRGSVKERLDGDMVLSYNPFLIALRKRLAMPENRIKINKRTSRSVAKFNASSRYINSLFTRWGDLFVVAFNLYPNDHCYFPTPQNLDISKKLPSLITKYLSTIKQVKNLSGLVGFIGKWEYTPQRGLYARVVIFIKATTVSQANKESIFNALESNWRKISANSTVISDQQPNAVMSRGRFESTLITNNELFKNGMAYQVKRNRSELRKILKENVVAYLTRSDLYVKENKINLTNVFFRGELPVKKKSSKLSESETIMELDSDSID